LEKGQESVTAGRKFHAIVNAFAFSVFCQLLRKGVLRIGTDDPENLARFLDGKISEQRT